MMTKMHTEQVDVIVVGTGWNGLICAKTYLELAPGASLILVDQGASIGGVWSSEKIYPTLYAQIKYGQFEYSCYPMIREGITDDGYVSGETIHHYLFEFAQKYHLVERTRLRTTVRHVSRIAGGQGWRLETEKNDAGTCAVVECAKLIYASGATSQAVMPSWPKASTFNVPVIHSQETGLRLDGLANPSVKRTIVVGAAKSSFDTVILLLNQGKSVDWIIREDGSGPLALMPPTIGGIFNTMEVVATRIVAILGASIMSTEGLGYQMVHQTRLGRLLTKQFWRVINMIAATHAGYHKSDTIHKLTPMPDGEGVFWASAGLGAASVPNFWKTLHAGDLKVHKTEITSLTGINTANLANGDRLDTDYVILCTGFDKSYQPFSPELQRECGLAPETTEFCDMEKWARLEAEAENTVDRLLPILRSSPLKTKAPAASQQQQSDDQEKHVAQGPSRHYRRLISPKLAAQGDRSIFFPGFIHSIYTPLVSESQALWGCAFLLGLLQVPSQDDMEREVAEWNVWSRKRYPVQGRKHAYAIYDFLGYIDVLLVDLGVETRRVNSWWRHLFMPVYPRQYQGLVPEFLAAKTGKKGMIKTKAGKESGPYVWTWLLLAPTILTWLLCL